MNLEDRVAEAIRATTDTVQPRTPYLAVIRTSARRQARRRAAAGLAATVVAVAVTWASVVTGHAERRSLPPVDLPDEPQTVVIPASRPEPVLVDPGVTSPVVPAEGVLAAASTTDPAYDGDGSSVTLTVDGTDPVRWEARCSGAPEAWYVLVIEPAGVIDTGQCDEAELGSPGGYVERAGDTFRMFLTGHDPSEFRDCFVSTTADGCSALEHPLRGSGAAMGITTYAWQDGPVAVSMFGYPFPARDSALDRTWTLTRAAAAASRARSLSFAVDASDRERVLQVVVRVREDAGGRTAKALPVVRIRLDGQDLLNPALDGPFFGEGTWARLEPGTPHDIRLRLAGGDPGAVELGALVYEADS